MAPKKKLPPKLDPIFPLPEGTGIPPVENGRGKEIMQNDAPVVVVLPYRSFYFLWEHAERQGVKEYPKYVGTTMDHAAQTWLDAVHAFRNAAAGQDLKRYPETTAQKARAAWERIQKQRKAVQKRTTAVKGQRDVPEAATEPSEAISEPKQSKARKKAPARRRAASRPSEGPSKRKPRSAKRTS